MMSSTSRTDFGIYHIIGRHLNVNIYSMFIIVMIQELGVQGTGRNQQSGYRFPITKVSACPRDREAWKLASVRRNCKNDNSLKHRYLCVPDENKTQLVAFCYDQTRPRVQEGYCIELRGTGTLNQIKCHRFKKGCPSNSYFADEIYKYPECLNIDTELRCFLADPNCKPPPQKPNREESLIKNTNIHVHLSTETLIVLSCFIAVIAACLVLLYRRKKQSGQNNIQELSNLLATQRPHADTSETSMETLITERNRSIPDFLSAAKDGNIKVVSSFLKENFDVNRCNEFKQTALHLAAFSGYQQIVKELIKYGANVDAKDENNDTPLIIAACNNHFEIVKELITHGANVNVYNNCKKTPLYTAAKRGYFDVVEYLVCHGADVNYCTTKNRSPLIRAAKRNHYEIVLFLISHDADVNIRDLQKESALSHAVQGGHTKIATELRKKGAQFDT